MFVLLSNDDGYEAPELNFLAKALRPLVSRLVIVAPHTNQSASSYSLTVSRSLSLHQHGDEVYSIDGTPFDCVLLAMTGRLNFHQRPDMVISGMNRGANLGDDVLHSGTVGAAFAGHHLGLPALAISLVAHEPRYGKDGARIAAELFAHLRRQPLPSAALLNVNIPDLPYNAIKGMKTTVLGDRLSAAKDSDFQAISEGYVSITPLQFDLTDHHRLADVQRWLQDIHE